jgi:hypothetical protein
MSEQSNVKLRVTIAGLRLCNAAQNEVIANLEEYQRTVQGLVAAREAGHGGLRGSYGRELEYLHSRRHALDSLISAVERYGALAEKLSPRLELAVAE